MPVKITKNKGGSYRVSTPHATHAKHTSKRNAERQARLLNAVDHGWRPTGKPARESVQTAAIKIAAGLLDG